jgi:hypothetical protein
VVAVASQGEAKASFRLLNNRIRQTDRVGER